MDPEIRIFTLTKTLPFRLSYFCSTIIFHISQEQRHQKAHVKFIAMSGLFKNIEFPSGKRKKKQETRILDFMDEKKVKSPGRCVHNRKTLEINSKKTNRN